MDGGDITLAVLYDGKAPEKTVPQPFETRPFGTDPQIPLFVFKNDIYYLLFQQMIDHNLSRGIFLKTINSFVRTYPEIPITVLVNIGNLVTG